jgi:phosphonate transport system substrate-binding protein
MSYVMTVSPDFAPDHIAGWYIFNTWLQQQLDTSIHLELYNSFNEQRAAIADDQIDLILANPFDATMLVREKKFVAIASPENSADEAVIAASASSDIKAIEDLKEGTRIARTDDPDVNMMGMIMLEPADLNTDNTISETVISYPVVAKNLLQGNADIGFFLDESFDNLSGLVRNQLHEVIRSEIFVIKHVLLAGPKIQGHHQMLSEALLSMPNTEKGPSVLKSMGMTGWDIQTQEDTEFMIDLMDTLVD